MDDKAPEKHPMNLNSSDFNPELYVNGLVHKKGLDELVAIEEDMVQNVRRLDSEMQQLVYENYSKFLSATNTVRSMQDQFSQMCDDLTNASSKINNILTLNDSLCGIFKRHRENVKKLNDAAKTVKGLQFVVKLPQKLQVYIDQKDYKKAVTSYSCVKHKIDQYKNIPSMAGIYSDTMELISQVEETLRGKLTSRLISSNDLVESVQLLQELGITQNELESIMVKTWKDQISTDIQILKNNNFNDILEFAENGCCNLLTTISIAVNLYPQLFPDIDNQVFYSMIDDYLSEFDSVIRDRFKIETDTRNCAIYVRALDRIYRKMSACGRLITWKDYKKMNNNIVIFCANNQINNGRRSISEVFENTYCELISEDRNNLPVSDTILQIIQKLEQTYLVAVKTTLANLLLFTASDITFSTIDQNDFFNSFSLNVFEEVVAGSVNDLISVSNEIISKNISGKNGNGYLSLAQFFNITKKKHISYLMDLCQEQFRLTARSSELTRSHFIIDNLDSMSKILLKIYTDHGGTELSKLCDYYLENNDWLTNSKPNSISKGITEILEYVSNISKITSCLFIDSPRKEKSPDLRSTPRHGPSSNFDTGSISNALERMWADRVECSTVIEFSQESIMLAITKIGLRSLIESTRLSVFSSYGLQQIQVDCLFLKHKLWEWVPDEHVLNCLYDDLISSAINQCDDPRLLDPAIAKRICEESDR